MLLSTQLIREILCRSLGFFLCVQLSFSVLCAAVSRTVPSTVNIAIDAIDLKLCLNFRIKNILEILKLEGPAREGDIFLFEFQ